MATVTREYYDSLIDLFEKLVRTPVEKITPFMALKKQLKEKVDRIQKFNLFPLTFSEHVLETLASEDCRGVYQEKMEIITELHFELLESLHFTRLTYGGEMIYYTSRIQIIILELPYAEFDMWRMVEKPSAHWKYNGLEELTSQQALDAKRSWTAAQLVSNKRTPPDKKQVKNDAQTVRSKLREGLEAYQHYIITHYPQISDQFRFYNKDVRAYLTEAMASNQYELRIHAYQPTAGDSGLTVIESFYDFYPAYFYNLEEIAEKQVFAMVTGIMTNSIALGDIFETHNIHQELLDIYISNATEAGYLHLIIFLLRCSGYEVSEISGKDRGTDLYGNFQGDYFEAQLFHRRQRDIGYLDKFVDRFRWLNPKQQLICIFSTYPGQAVMTALRNRDIKVLTLEDLCMPFFKVSNSIVLHWYIKDRLQGLQINPRQIDIHATGESLTSELKRCPKGKKSWTEYERLGARIFEFLFADNFKTYQCKTQAQNETKNHRRDLMVNNNPLNTNSFWADQKITHQSQAIIIDFKNYSEKLNADTLLKITKYMKPNLGNFALVFSRQGIDSGATTAQIEQMRQGRLILDLSDDDLLQMIREKIVGKDPIDRLETKKFLLIRSI